MKTTIEIASKKSCENNVEFLTSKLHRKKFVETTIEIASKKKRENNVDFSTSKIHLKKYVETIWIFRAAKLRRKGTWKRRGFLDQRNYI